MWVLPGVLCNVCVVSALLSVNTSLLALIRIIFYSSYASTHPTHGVGGGVVVGFFLSVHACGCLCVHFRPQTMIFCRPWSALIIIVNLDKKYWYRHFIWYRRCVTAISSLGLWLPRFCKSRLSLFAGHYPLHVYVLHGNQNWLWFLLRCHFFVCWFTFSSLSHGLVFPIPGFWTEDFVVPGSCRDCGISPRIGDLLL